MKSVVTLSKVTPPRLPKILQRPRLTNLLEKNKNNRLTLIVAQPAQGKSTLASSFIEKSEIPSAWANLSEDESDPVNLFYLIVAAMQNVLTEIDLSSLLIYPSVNLGPRLEIPLYRQWASALSNLISSPLRFVLDGLDRLSPDAPSFKFLEILADNLPQGTNLIILSRTLPPFDVQGLKIKQEASIISNEDLAFTFEEVRAYFKHIRKLTLTPEQLLRIHRVTEGWVGGLILLSETLEKLNEKSRDRYLFEDIQEEFRDQIFRYIGEEVFSSQPSLIRDFLIKSSTMDILEPSVVNELLGVENSYEILQALAEANLFVSSIYDRKNVFLFRYHQLFRDFLNVKFNTVIAEKDRKSLLLKAGAIYEKKGALEQSIRHYLGGKDFTCAANVIQHAGMKFLKMGRTGDLTHWLQALPEDTVKDNPWLLFFLCMTRRFKGVQENLNTLPMALENFRKRKEMQGVLFCLAALLEAIIAAGLPWKYLKKALDEAEPLLDSTNLDSYPYEKALLFSQFGYGHALRGNLHKGLLALQQCFLLSSSLGDPILQADCLSHCVVAFTMSGEYFSADEYSKKLEKVAADCPLPELQTLHLLANSILCSFKGEVKRAKKLIELALEKIESHGLIYYYPVALMYKVFYCAFSEIYSEMENVGNHLVEMASSMGNTVLAASTTFFLGLNAYRQGNYEKAKKLIDKSHDLCSPKNTNTQMQWYASKMVRVLISLDLKQGSGTENDLLEALGFFTRVNNRRFLAEIHLSMALLKWQQSRKDEVIGHLNTGFELAKEVQHDHFLIMNGKDRVRACTLAVELKASKALSYAEHLLISKFAALSKPELKRLEKSKNRRICRKAKEIELAISREYAPQLRIETLGGFNVFKDGSPLNENDWPGSQPKNLLKAIVAIGQERRVHKEVLIDALWPDSNAEAAEKTFKTALHRLRKAIEPVMKNSPGFLYVHLKEKKVYLDSELCTVDTWEFLSLVKEGQELQNKGNNEAALSAYRKAIGLYKGNFLPRDLYESWADSKRRELKHQYVDILLRSAKIEETRGSLTKAIALYEKVIREDPYLELTYQRLMTLYFDRGKRNEALKVYEKCKKALREGLATKPDLVTNAIHKRISE